MGNTYVIFHCRTPLNIFQDYPVKQQLLQARYEETKPCKTGATDLVIHRLSFTLNFIIKRQ